jgi:putative ABC transport system permease protein
VFDNRDTYTSTPVVLINQAMARRYWAHADPMRDRLLIAPTIGGELEETVPRQIIGVVGDVHNLGLRQDPRASVYVPLAQISDRQEAFFSRVGGSMTWIVRTRGEPHRFAQVIQNEIRTASGGLPAERIRSMDDVSEVSTAQNAFEVWLMTVFGAIAMLLAAVGLYGVMSYSVEQRRREIGIRMALGADVTQVRQMVLIQGMKLTAAGVVVGIASALGSTRLLAGFLFGVGQHDRVVFTVVPLVLGAIALAAVWIPARSATSVDPMMALRAE